MARPRKNAPKPSTQELALVPVEEQPYPLPEGWKWVRLGDVAEIVTGGTPSKKNPEFYGGDFPFFKPSDLDAGRHVFLPSEYLTQEGKLQCRIIPANSIGICCIGSIGKSGYFDIECTTNQQINTAIPKFNALYLYYYTKTISFTNELWQKASATTIAIVNKTKLESCTFPLSPLDEQERIVTRIESLFAKLDEAKEKAEAVLDSYETRKAAILHKAFTGELTAKWREERGIKKESWKMESFARLITKIEAGKNFRCEERPPVGDEVGVVKVSAVTWGVFNEYESKTCPDNSYYNKTYKIQKGDLLFSRANTLELVGKFVIVNNISKNLMLSDKILRITTTNDITQSYLFLFSCTRNYRVQIESLASGNQDGMRNVSQKNLLKVQISLPSIAEQQEITRILDSLLKKEQQSKEAAETVLEQIDLMKKAILAKAFRGELGN